MSIVVVYISTGDLYRASELRAALEYASSLGGAPVFLLPCCADVTTRGRLPPLYRLLCAAALATQSGGEFLNAFQLVEPSAMALDTATALEELLGGAACRGAAAHILLSAELLTCCIAPSAAADDDARMEGVSVAAPMDPRRRQESEPFPLFGAAAAGVAEAAAVVSIEAETILTAADACVAAAPASLCAHLCRGLAVRHPSAIALLLSAGARTAAGGPAAEGVSAVVRECLCAPLIRRLHLQRLPALAIAAECRDAVPLRFVQRAGIEEAAAGAIKPLSAGAATTALAAALIDVPQSVCALLRRYCSAAAEASPFASLGGWRAGFLPPGAFAPPLPLAHSPTLVAASNGMALPSGGSGGAAAPRHVAILGGSFSPPTIGHMDAVRAVARALARRAEAAGGGEEGDRCSPTDIDELWIVPCGLRPDKPSLAVSPWHRYAMCVLALEEALSGEGCGGEDAGTSGGGASGGGASGGGATSGPRIAVMPLELTAERAVPSAHLFPGLARRFPGARFHLIIGTDLLPTLGAWIAPQTILGDLSFIVLPRPGYPLLAPPDAPAATAVALPAALVSQHLAAPLPPLRRAPRVRCLPRRSSDEPAHAWLFVAEHSATADISSTQVRAALSAAAPAPGAASIGSSAVAPPHAAAAVLAFLPRSVHTYLRLYRLYS